jgi:dTDP-4-dehydrorhamnose reductase
MQILVTGASGRLGSRVLENLADRGHQVAAWSGTTEGRRFGFPLRRVDLGDPLAVRAAIEQAGPDVVIHAGGMSSADAVRRDPALARKVNVRATEVLSAWCGEQQRRLLFTSTDLVFDGSKSWYGEDDPAIPILEYGRTKLAAEALVFKNHGGLVVRLSLLYGPSRGAPPSYFDQAIAAVRSGMPQTFFEDEFRTPLDYATAAEILVRLAESDATGIIHAGGPERVSRLELMLRAARALGADATLLGGNRRADAAGYEPRPADVSLDTSLLRAVLPDLVLPTIEETLAP